MPPTEPKAGTELSLTDAQNLVTATVRLTIRVESFHKEPT